MIDADKATAQLTGPHASAGARRRTKPSRQGKQATVATPRRDPDARRLRHPIGLLPTPLAWLPWPVARRASLQSHCFASSFYLSAAGPGRHSHPVARSLLPLDFGKEASDVGCMVRHSTTGSNSASRNVFLSSVADSLWSLGWWLVRASSLMERPTGPPFLSFAKQNRHPALTETRSHALLSDEIISKDLLCLVVMLDQISFISLFFLISYVQPICTTIMEYLTFRCSYLMPLQFCLKWRCHACSSFCFHLTQLTCQLCPVSPTDTLIALAPTPTASGSLWISSKPSLVQSSAFCFYSAWAADVGLRK